MNLSSPIKRLSAIAFVEGVTLLALVIIAMPLKYVASQPEWVSIMGPIHGMAFIVYLIVLIENISQGGWSKADFIKTLVAAFIPFGTFWNEKLLKQKAQQEALATNH